MFDSYSRTEAMVHVMLTARREAADQIKVFQEWGNMCDAPWPWRSIIAGNGCFPAMPDGIRAQEPAGVHARAHPPPQSRSPKNAGTSITLTSRVGTIAIRSGNPSDTSG